MARLDIIANNTLKEAITSLSLVDVTGDGRDEIVVSTIQGDARVLHLEADGSVSEIARFGALAPIATMGIGDVTGDGVPDLVVGGLDHSLKVIALHKEELAIRCECPLGTIPTALCVANVMGDEKAEVIIATDDNALRCFGWYDVTLDKLAHKVVERPVFSIQPFRSKGIPYSRFVFGDDSEYVFIYQYADDRLHELSKMRARGAVDLVATGSVTGGRLDEIVAISNRNITLFGYGSSGLEFYDNLRAPGQVSSVKIGSVMREGISPGQVIVSQTNTLLSVLSLDGRRLVEEGSVKSRSKAAESLIDYGDVDGDGQPEIVQAAANDLFIVSVED
ncbi:MAG: FG-GAP repeat domain-containing protein [Candidatus Thorarchaeota archaeon]